MNTTTVARHTPSHLISRLTAALILARNPMFVTGKVAAGGLPDQMNSPDTRENTQETDLSSANCVREHSAGQTTWLFT